MALGQTANIAQAAANSGLQGLLKIRIETHQATEAGVVPELGMSIQRQVIGQQADLAAQQRSQSPPFHSHHLRCLAAPEITVMNQQGISSPRYRFIQKTLASGDAGGESRNPGPTFYLQAIGAVILEEVRLQALLQVMAEFSKGYAHITKYPQFADVALPIWHAWARIIYNAIVNNTLGSA